MIDDSASPSASWDSLLPGFLAGDPEISEHFVKKVTPYVRSIAKSLGGDLAADIRGEIVQQALMECWRTGQTRYDPLRMSAKQLLRGHAWNAVRTVRAQYTRPGALKRADKRKQSASLLVAITAPTTTVTLDDLSQVEDTAAAKSFEQLEARVDVERICRTAPARMRTALDLMRQGSTLPEAAQRVGKTRFRLRYELRAFGLRRA